MSKTVAAVTSQADVIEEVIALSQQWTSLGGAIGHFSQQAAAMTFVDFQNTAASLFSEADQRLLHACKEIASINTALRTLNALL